MRFGRFESSNDATKQAVAARSHRLISEFVIADYDAPPDPVSHEMIPTTPGETVAAGRRPLSVASMSASPVKTKSASPKPDKTPAAQPARALPNLPASRSIVPPNAWQAAIMISAAGKPIEDETPPPRPRIAVPPKVLTATALPLDSVQADYDAANILPINSASASGVAAAIISDPGWEIVRYSAPGGQHLNAVHFTDALNGWAGGEAGAVWRTSDGGRHWKVLSSLDGVSVSALYFADAGSGWVIGEARDKQAVLFHTTDGGRSWREQSAPGITRLQFVDKLHGWAVGRNATLLRTTDGGAEWKRYEETGQLFGAPVEGSVYNFGFSDVYFTDAEHGWAVGNFYGRTRTHIGGLFVTGDGGGSWKRVPLPIKPPKPGEPAGAVTASAGPGHTPVVTGRIIPGALRTVRFADVNTGSVVGEMSDGEAKYLFALQTKDGGRTWEQFQTPGLATAGTYFLSPERGWAVAATESPADAYDMSLVRTEDGGLTWRKDLTMRGSRIRGVFFLSPGKGWAVGDHGMILRYEDRNK